MHQKMKVGHYVNMCFICQYVVITSGLEFARRALAFHFRFLTECRFTEEKNIKQKLANMYIEVHMIMTIKDKYMKRGA